MGFLQKKTTWTNLEFIPLKLAIASIYLILGSLLSNFVEHLQGFLTVLFIVTVTLSLYLWITKMNKEN